MEKRTRDVYVLLIEQSVALAGTLAFTPVLAGAHPSAMQEASGVLVRKKASWSTLRGMTGFYPATSFIGSNAHQRKQVLGKEQCSGGRRLRRIRVALHQTLTHLEPCRPSLPSGAPPLSGMFEALATKANAVRQRACVFTAITGNKANFSGKLRATIWYRLLLYIVTD